tara:strand:- start:746 stop:1120 length:375 start_codon:yes stop_codon:yes gene_type:complete
MKSRYFNLLTSNHDFLSFGQDRSVNLLFFLKYIVYAAIGFSLTLVLASCREMPTGRVQISNDLMMALTQQIPLHQSAIPAAIGTASNFDKAILQAVEANETYRAALFMERESMAGIGVAESVRR